MEFKVGDKVKLAENSHYRHEENQIPDGVNATIVSISGGTITVDWGQGRNTYVSDDLVMAHSIQ